MTLQRENREVAKFLIQNDWVRPEEVAKALELARQENRPIVDILIRLKALNMDRAMEIKRLLNSMQGEGRQNQIPGYKLVRRLGMGGMGTVYEALCLRDRKRVAIKVLNKEVSADQEYVRRFLREVKIMIQIKHPNIVGCLDFGETKEGYYYYVMEYVDGVSGFDWLEQRKHQGELPREREVAYIGAQVAQAMMYYNQKNIVHRDIKPDNLLIGPKAKTKVCDLGLAKREEMDTRITEAGITLGTPHYFSPEQAKGEKLDIRSDIYALGATLYHFLVGEEPYQGNNVVRVMQQHLYSPVPSPKEKRPDLSEDFDGIIQKMMAKAPEDRYQTPEELYRDLYYIVKEGQLPKEYKKGKKRLFRSSVSRRRSQDREAASPVAAIPRWLWVAALLSVLAMVAVILLVLLG